MTGLSAARGGAVPMISAHDELMAECEKTARKLMKIARVGVKFNKAAINRAFENMGFLDSIYHNLELVVHFDTTKTEEQETFNRIRKEKGLRAALDWRDALFKEED